MDDFELIQRILKRPEGPTVDFKSGPIRLKESYHKAKFIKNLICMANTPRDDSAFIISGVICNPSGNKEVVGIREDQHPDDANLQELAKGKLERIPHFYYRPVSYGGVSLGILEVYPRRNGPFMSRFELPNIIVQGVVYFRRGSSNAIASPEELREIMDWMGTEAENASQTIRLTGSTFVDVGGSPLDFPCFFPSISSLRTQLNPLGYLRVLRASTYPLFLISAYDIYHSGKEDRKQIEGLLREVSTRKRILLDCGYYESSWKNDKEWTEDKFWSMLRSCQSLRPGSQGPA